MATSRINEVKAPQHRGTPRSHRKEAAFVVDDCCACFGRRGDVQIPPRVLRSPPTAHVVVLQGLLALRPDAALRVRNLRGPFVDFFCHDFRLQSGVDERS